MKRFLCLLTVLCLGTCLSGCGGAPTTPAAAPPPDPDKKAPDGKDGVKKPVQKPM